MKAQHTYPITINDTPTPGEIQQIKDRFDHFNQQATAGQINQPGIEIQLALKDPQGQVCGGVIASTVYHVMHLEVLWVAEGYRRLGYGGALVLAAEEIGFREGCNSAQTWTFAFQGPGFYPTLGYRQLGVYDGYPDGLTEHVFLKRLATPAQKEHRKRSIFGAPDQRGLTLTDQVSEKDLDVLHKGLHGHVVANIGDGHKGTKIALTLKDPQGALVGGFYAWTTLRNMIFEHLWVDEGYRGLGWGRKLMTAAERIARESGCIASQASAFSFQAPGFFEKMGYQTLGVSDGYPPPVKEVYLIKKYEP